jgi:hypothetical protein
MPTVYIPNKSGHDFEPAKKFGELVFLSEGESNPYEVGKIYREFASVLKDSKPNDYIVISGLQVMNCVASAIMSRLHGRVNWLQWYAQKGIYKSRTVMIDNLLGGQNASL